MRTEHDAAIAPLTTMRVGGPADWLLQPADEDDLADFLAALDPGVPVFPMGVGSNLIVLDGGIRRGSDVVKAVALGARAVMIGRAYLWGLAAGGQAGVENVLDILRGGIDSALLGLGLSSIQELRPEDLVIPSGFRRDLGV
mgnify:CR=1 FL=1